MFLRLGLSNLCEHKYKHSFQDFIKPLRNSACKVQYFSSTVLCSQMKEALSLVICVI